MHCSSRCGVLCYRGNYTTNLTTTSVKVLTNRQGTSLVSIRRGGTKSSEQPIGRGSTRHSRDSTRDTTTGVSMTRSGVM